MDLIDAPGSSEDRDGLILGYYIGGVVEKIGSSVTNVSVGDEVGLYYQYIIHPSMDRLYCFIEVDL